MGADECSRMCMRAQAACGGLQEGGCEKCREEVHLHDTAVAVCEFDSAGVDEDRGALFPAKAHIEAHEDLVAWQDTKLRGDDLVEKIQDGVNAREPLRHLVARRSCQEFFWMHSMECSMFHIDQNTFALT